MASSCVGRQVEMEVEGDGIWDDLRSVYGRFAITLVKSLGFHPVRGGPVGVGGTWSYA